MRCKDERGSAIVEITLITPLLFMFILLTVVGGQIELARSEVDGAAHDAARAASLRRSSASAVIVAKSTAEAGLQSGHAECRTSNVNVDTSSFRAGGWVAVDVTCNADLSALSLLRIPGSKSVHVRSVEPIDTYRGAA